MFPLPIPSLNSKWIISGIAALAVLLGVYLTVDYVKDTMEENTILKTENTQLQTALGTEKQATQEALKIVEKWDEAFNKYQRLLEEYNKAQREASKEARRLDELFSEHDLGKLARARPGLVQKRVNSGTDSARRMLECASTGDPQCAVRGEETR